MSAALEGITAIAMPSVLTLHRIIDVNARKDTQEMEGHVLVSVFQEVHVLKRSIRDT